MEIVFDKEYKSIREFDPTVLPEFSVLTGINGSGKTHLLESINAGHSIINDVDPSEIKYFNPSSFYVENENEINSQQIDGEKIGIWKTFNGEERRNGHNIKNAISQYRAKLGPYYEQLKVIAEETNSPLLKISSVHISDSRMLNAYNEYKTNTLKLFESQQIVNDYNFQGIKSLALQIYESLDLITEDEFKDKFKPLPVKNDTIPSQLGRIFLNYKYKEYQSLVIRKAEAEHYGEDVEISSEEEFRQKYGPKPWAVLQDIISGFSSLDFSITNPDSLKFRSDQVTKFTLNIKRNSDGKTIPFNDLSSGEKILFALVYSMYKGQIDGVFPKVLLLDEIDSSLHPSMIKNLLYTIKEVFIKQYNVAVIMVTHSPTTIALSDDDSIYVINKGNAKNKIMKTPRDEALNILTEGYMSLSEGLTLLDGIMQKEITIFTEGNNVDYLKKSVEVISPELIGKIEYAEQISDKSGHNQLSVLYEFFLRLNHDNKVLFVYDADVKVKHQELNNTFFYVFSRNSDNEKIKNGIENMFPESLILDEHYVINERFHDDGKVAIIKAPNKRKMCDHIVANAKAKDFVMFNGFIEKLRSIL
jgi:AAA15 family ATPase/GTPase